MKTALPCFAGKGSRMRMQSLPGSLFPSPKRAWGRDYWCIDQSLFGAIYKIVDMVDGPGAPFGLVGEERWTAALVPLAELGEDNVEEPRPV